MTWSDIYEVYARLVSSLISTGTIVCPNFGVTFPHFSAREGSSTPITQIPMALASPKVLPFLKDHAEYNSVVENVTYRSGASGPKKWETFGYFTIDGVLYPMPPLSLPAC